MSKKQFKDSPAIAFINPQENAYEQTQGNAYEQTQGNAYERTQGNAHERTQENAYEQTQENAYEQTQEIKHDDTQQETQERAGYIRTQGRKGFKKPRINLAFDSEIFLDKIRNQADKEGKSITQFVNDVIADYLKKCKGKK